MDDTPDLFPGAREFPAGTRTAADAATAIGCSVAAIVKSLVFARASDDAIVLVTLQRRTYRRHGQPRAGQGECRPRPRSDRLRDRRRAALGLARASGRGLDRRGPHETPRSLGRCGHATPRVPAHPGRPGGPNERRGGGGRPTLIVLRGAGDDAPESGHTVGAKYSGGSTDRSPLSASLARSLVPRVRVFVYAQMLCITSYMRG